MSWQRRLAALAVVAATASACSGDPAEPTPELGAEATTTTTLVDDSTTTSFTGGDDSSADTTSTSTVSIVDTAPRTLAFSSTADLGRLFEVDGAVEPSASAGSEPIGTELIDGTLVQATNLRSRDGVVWVLVTDAGSPPEALGWVLADDLRPTTESIERFDSDAVGELRQAGRVIEDDALPIRTSPGGGSTVGSLREREVAMHGGTTVLLPSGDAWADVIDAESSRRIGWVLDDSFSTLTSGVVQTSSGDADRRPDHDLTYGASIGGASAAMIGCNAVQIEIHSSSTSRGLALVFGTDTPTGRPLTSGAFLWGAPGGTTVYADPGDSILLTVPTSPSGTWHFASLDDDGQAQAVTSTNGTALLDENGLATATGVRTVDVEYSTCGEPVVEAEAPPSSEAPATEVGAFSDDPSADGDAGGQGVDPTAEGSSADDGPEETAPSSNQGDDSAPVEPIAPPPGDTVPPTG